MQKFCSRSILALAVCTTLVLIHCETVRGQSNETEKVPIKIEVMDIGTAFKISLPDLIEGLPIHIKLQIENKATTDAMTLRQKKSCSCVHILDLDKKSLRAGAQTELEVSVVPPQGGLEQTVDLHFEREDGVPELFCQLRFFARSNQPVQIPRFVEFPSFKNTTFEIQSLIPEVVIDPEGIVLQSDDIRIAGRQMVENRVRLTVESDFRGRADHTAILKVRCKNLDQYFVVEETVEFFFGEQLRCSPPILQFVRQRNEDLTCNAILFDKRPIGAKDKGKLQADLIYQIEGEYHILRRNIAKPLRQVGNKPYYHLNIQQGPIVNEKINGNGKFVIGLTDLAEESPKVDSSDDPLNDDLVSKKYALLIPIHF
jgi:hypothetical protein